MGTLLTIGLIYIGLSLLFAFATHAGLKEIQMSEDRRVHIVLLSILIWPWVVVQLISEAHEDRKFKKRANRNNRNI